MIAKPPAANTLYYGDNLAVMRAHLRDESVDLVYLDPPFNSNASYNVLFKAPEGHRSQAQIEAFDDTWHWGPSAQLAFDEVIGFGNSDAAEMLRAIRVILGDNALMAYLAMMAIRLLELKRVLKKTGSLYLHCDPTASHYLKILLDSIFGAPNFLNEIIWRRTGSHNKAKRFGPIHDVILFYQASDSYIHTPVFQPYMFGHVRSYFKKKDKEGQFWTNALTGAGTRKGESGSVWRNYDPTARNRHWAIPGSIIEELGIDSSMKTLAKLDALAEAGFVDFPKKDSAAMPTYKQYLNKSPGMLLQDIWAYQPHTQHCVWGGSKGIDEDVRWLTAQGDKERLGYPTQKPVGLLERILSASAKEGDVVLDPFCGCGTTLHAAAKMQLNWIGIDITHLAIGLIRRRIGEAFPYVKYNVVGVPKDIDGARALSDQDKYEFQKWALSMISAVPYKGGKKGGDGGVDGFLYFKPDGKKTEKAIISVKGGASLNPAMVKDLIVTVDQQDARMGVFLTLEPPTKGMISQAAAAGSYITEFGKFPKIQIVTISQLFSPGNPLHMPWQDTSVFKKTKREETKSQSKLDLRP